MSTIAGGMLITWILPDWIQKFTIFHTYYEHGKRAHEFLLYNQDIDLASRIVLYLVLIAVFFGSSLWLSYFNQQCVFEAVISHIPRLIIAYQYYAYHDYTIDMDLTTIWLQLRNTLIEFSLTWLALSNIGMTWKVMKAVLWLLMPAILTLIAWSLASIVTKPRWKVIGMVRMSIAIPIGYILDWIDYLEEILLSSFPRAVRCYYSDFTSSRRRKAAKYEYSSIGEDEIRLLVFQPVRYWWTGIPEARMLIVKVSTMKAQKYDAISYRWTSSARTETILIDGRRFDITRSAFDSLLSRCQGNKERKIWIDAICINQENQQEKAMQVKMMTDIYFKARRVIACPTDVWRPRLLAWTIAYKMEPPRFTDEIYGVDWHRFDGGRFIPPRWRALALFARNSYFERAWIVQEVAAGCKVEIYLGGIYIDWAEFYAYTSHLTETAKTSVWFGAAISPDGKGVSDKNNYASILGEHPHENIQHLASLRGDFDLRVADVIPITFERALLETRAFKSSDPRDLVYAMMGVCRNDVRARNIIPDYSKPVDEVLLELARVVFFDSTHKSLDLLALAGIGRQRRESVPSWVPNLESQPLYGCFTSTAYAKRVFKAGSGKISVSAGSLSNSMALTCCVEDMLATISEPFIIASGNHSSTINLSAVKQKIQFVEDAVKLVGLEKLGSDDVSNRIAATFLGGRDQELQKQRFCPSEMLRFLMINWQGILQPNQRSDANLEQMQKRLDEVGAWSEAFKKGLLSLTHSLMMSACHGRRFGVTIKGRFCLVPPLARVGDDIVVPHGAQVPFLIRQTPITACHFESHPTSELFELVGECYVDGIMDGEAFQAENPIHQTIVLI